MEMEITFPGGMRVDALYNGFNIATDQSPADGGQGSAPEPFALFLASLATCAGVYVLSFCQTRQLPTQGLGMRLESFSGPDGKGLARLEITVVLPDGFPDKYRKAVLRVADQCAVKKAIFHPPEIVLKTADG